MKFKKLRKKFKSKQFRNIYKLKNHLKRDGFFDQLIQIIYPEEEYYCSSYLLLQVQCQSELFDIKYVLHTIFIF
jgi:hypothetical protein